VTPYEPGYNQRQTPEVCCGHRIAAHDSSTTKDKTMQTEIVYSPIISLGGQLTSMHKHKPMGIFKIWRTNWRRSAPSRGRQIAMHLPIVAFGFACFSLGLSIGNLLGKMLP
jgi:hypothetical protein